MADDDEEEEVEDEEEEEKTILLTSILTDNEEEIDTMLGILFPSRYLYPFDPVIPFSLLS